MVEPKDLMQGKLIAVACTLRTYWNWAEFVNKNRCMQCSFSIRVGWKHSILIILIIVSYDKNISSIFLCERWIPCQASTSFLGLHYRPETVHYSTKDAYTSEITFLALQPWVEPMSTASRKNFHQTNDSDELNVFYSTNQKIVEKKDALQKY